jgi:serine/threonine protein kinase
MTSHLFVQRLRLLASRVPHYSRQGRGGACRSRISVTGATVGGILVVTTSASLFVANYCSCQQEVESSERTSERTFQVQKVFKIKKVLGEGGFAKVYKATRISDGAVVALKAIDSNSTEDSAFQREIHALTLLSNPGHPHVCRLYSQHEDRNYYYLEMELIEGGELFEHLIENGPFSERGASRFVKQHAQALSYIHSKGLVHADLKPENLMMDSWDESKATLKFVDFGSACVAGEKVGLNDLTYAYAPPEIFGKDGKFNIIELLREMYCDSQQATHGID